jgi:hypothetical protein
MAQPAKQAIQDYKTKPKKCTTEKKEPASTLLLYCRGPRVVNNPKQFWLISLFVYFCMCIRCERKIRIPRLPFK